MDVQKVYIVTAGTYSDYHIEKVFTDKLKAELYSATIDSFIEEFDISDEEIQGKIFYRYELRLYYDSQAKYEHEKYGFNLSQRPIKQLDSIKNNCKGMYVSSDLIIDDTCIILPEEDFDKALKIARDKLAEFKAKIEQIF